MTSGNRIIAAMEGNVDHAIQAVRAELEIDANDVIERHQPPDEDDAELDEPTSEVIPAPCPDDDFPF